MVPLILGTPPPPPQIAVNCRNFRFRDYLTNQLAVVRIEWRACPENIDLGFRVWVVYARFGVLGLGGRYIKLAGFCDGSYERDRVTNLSLFTKAIKQANRVHEALL